MSTTLPLISSITIRTATSQMTYSQTSESGAEKTVSEAKGVEVNLSSEGKAAAAASSSNADIEQSGLPASVQKILKGIRELQRRIEETMEQIQKALNDQSLSPEERRTKAGALQTVLSTLQAQVSNSTADLSSLMNSLRSSDADKTKAGMLVLAKM
ncbi:chemotaxis protein [Pseudomonas syringae]|uniref:Chemotaxis protein n=1 Tax=Pseudomonas syringae TaxID=317 RepID=A0A244EPT0_PSESX|nr:chemotaxis protein [Pseudomonas syringae]MCI3944815.1 chemotaxis protein [Pseudomonas syringae]OUM06486.1 chemotaxis protein [Pseudomonas syringae]